MPVSSIRSAAKAQRVLKRQKQIEDRTLELIDVSKFLQDMRNAVVNRDFTASREVITEYINAVNQAIGEGMTRSHIWALNDGYAELKAFRQRQEKLNLAASNPFDLAIDVAENRLNMSTDDIQLLASDYTEKASFITGNLARSGEEEARKVIHDVVSENLIGREAEERLEIAMRSAGFGEDVLPGHHIKTIVRDQIQLTYSAASAEFDHLEGVDDMIWGYEYSATGDDRVRPEHEAMDGMRLAKDDPRWQTHRPPNGHNCRCLLIRIFTDEVDEFGPQEPAGTDLNGNPVNPVPDEGWDFNPRNASGAVKPSTDNTVRPDRGTSLTDEPSSPTSKLSAKETAENRTNIPAFVTNGLADNAINRAGNIANDVLSNPAYQTGRIGAYAQIAEADSILSEYFKTGATALLSSYLKKRKSARKDLAKHNQPIYDALKVPKKDRLQIRAKGSALKSPGVNSAVGFLQLYAGNQLIKRGIPTRWNKKLNVNIAADSSMPALSGVNLTVAERRKQNYAKRMKQSHKIQLGSDGADPDVFTAIHELVHSFVHNLDHDEIMAAFLLSNSASRQKLTDFITFNVRGDLAEIGRLDEALLYIDDADLHFKLGRIVGLNRSAFGLNSNLTESSGLLGAEVSAGQLAKLTYGGEILPVAAEAFYIDPAGLWESDPALFRLLLAVLRGEL